MLPGDKVIFEKAPSGETLSHNVLFISIEMVADASVVEIIFFWDVPSQFQKKIQVVC